MYITGNVVMTGGRIELNEAGIEGGGAYVSGVSTTLELVDVSVLRNSVDFFAADGGGVALAMGSLQCTRTDWGNDVADNEPHDVSRVLTGGFYDYDGLQTFSCGDTSGAACP